MTTSAEIITTYLADKKKYFSIAGSQKKLSEKEPRPNVSTKRGKVYSEEGNRHHLYLHLKSLNNLIDFMVDKTDNKTLSVPHTHTPVKLSEDTT